MPRYLAIDLGDRRTGLAVGDDETGLVMPLEVLEVPRGPALVRAIRDRVRSETPDELVLGLPLNMDGTEGDRARISRAFGADLERECDTTVRYHDERLTSFAAEQHLARSGRTRGQKQRLRDALAAAELLTDFLAGDSGGRAPS